MVEVPDHVGQMLVQGAAERHVDELGAATDPEHGQVGPQRGRQQRSLARATVRVDAGHLVVRFLAVGERVHVAAARQHEPVEHGDHLVRAGLGPVGRGARRGHQQGPAACGGCQLEIRLRQHAGSPLPRSPAHVGHVRAVSPMSGIIRTGLGARCATSAQRTHGSALDDRPRLPSQHGTCQDAS